jgi:MGT family glycosyltransferase
MANASKVLVYTSPARGHLYPIVDTALALARLGHSLSIRTLANEMGVVEAVGLRAAPIDPRIEALSLTDWQASTPIGSISQAFGVFVARAAIEVEDVRRAVDEERPDCLLIDTNCWGAQAAAQKSGVPWATWHPFPLPVPSVDAPPFGPGLRPATGPLGRIRDRILRPLLNLPKAKALRALNTLRANVGVPELTRMSDIYRQPPLIFLQSAEPFEYARRDWPANVALVGPGLWSPDAAPPSWLASTTKPIVLVTCSSEYQDDGRILAAAIEAFADDQDVQLVCSTGAVDPGTVPSHVGVIVERFVPHHLVLPRACAAVVHGGMGITQRAIAAGVPVCVVPWGRDQLEVGRRVVECCAGVMLPRAKLRADRLRASVVEARTCTKGVALVRAAYDGAGGAERSARLLTDLLGASSARRSEAALKRTECLRTN